MSRASFAAAFAASLSFGFVSVSGAADGGLPSADALATLGANGILGVGLGAIDCGPPCASAGAGNPGLYYSCNAGGGCTVTTRAESAQLTNPVILFPVETTTA
jgi:hypothetical protein